MEARLFTKRRYFRKGIPMATGKKFYWIKLRKDFMTSDTVDFLMSQRNGAQYVVLYQMLCFMCIDTKGGLSQIGRASCRERV